MTLGWLVLEYVVPALNYKYIGLFCDNILVVHRTRKGHTTTSTAAACLLCFLNLRQHARQTSSLLPVHIAGKENQMANICSHAFKSGTFHLTNCSLLDYFNSNFPLSQKKSWKEWKVQTDNGSKPPEPGNSEYKM